MTVQKSLLHATQEILKQAATIDFLSKEMDKAGIHSPLSKTLLGCAYEMLSDAAMRLAILDEELPSEIANKELD
jgi:hypothetical protein